MLNDLNNGFEELIRSKLEDYETAVEPDTWDTIEKSLIRRKHSKYVYRAASIAAAAVVLFLITLYLPDDNDTRQNNTQTNVISEESTFPATQPDVTDQTAKITVEQKQQTLEHLSEQKQLVSNPILTNKTIVAQTEKSEVYPEEPPIKEKLNIVPQTVSSISTNFSQPNKIQLSDNIPLAKLANRQQIDKQKDNKMADNKTVNLDKDTKNKGWSVSTSFIAGSYQNVTGNKKSSNLIAAAPLLTSSNSIDYVKNKYKNEISVPDNADSEYGLPLSANFIIRKNLDKRWAVESGLSYTYLPTKYKWNKNTVNQHLHYLGIPLNVVYYVVSKPSWNIYASAGGMVEKGVYSYIHRSDNLQTKPNMKGLQWSVNGTVGATYKLYKNLGIFFEPQFGYFFDNGQPESIRTEWPVSFGMGVGLRFNF